MTTSAGVEDTTRPTHAYIHRIRVRYGECDMQGVVFNANFLVYADDVIDGWFNSALGTTYQGEFDIMVKKATVEWMAPARYRELVEFRPHVSRWGNTSFDVTIDATVDNREVARITLLYVSVSPGTTTPTSVPRAIRTALGQAATEDP